MLNFKRKSQSETKQEIVQETADVNENNGNDFKNDPLKSKKTRKFDGNMKNFQAVKKVLLSVFTVVFLVMMISGTIYSLEEDEYAVIETLGQVEVVETPGIKFKIPFIQKVSKVSKASKQFPVGYDLETGQSVQNYSLAICQPVNFKQCL